MQLALPDDGSSRRHHRQGTFPENKGLADHRHGGLIPLRHPAFNPAEDLLQFVAVLPLDFRRVKAQRRGDPAAAGIVHQGEIEKGLFAVRVKGPLQNSCAVRLQRLRKVAAELEVRVVLQGLGDGLDAAQTFFNVNGDGFGDEIGDGELPLLLDRLQRLHVHVDEDPVGEEKRHHTDKKQHHQQGVEKPPPRPGGFPGLKPAGSGHGCLVHGHHVPRGS